jgi:hypothetical protein
MFELLTTDGFATWFSSLGADTAEDVAATLEVISELGAAKEAPESSDALLWYEHPSLSGRPLPDYKARFSPEFVKFTQDWGRFQGYVARIVRHLGSKAFTAHLAHLSPDEAAVVNDAVQRIRRLSTTRSLRMSEIFTKHRMNPFRAPTAAEAAVGARILDETEVRAAYFEALAAAGFEVTDVASTPAALREISLRSTPPGLRLLYGIDQPKNRGLVVLGEWLDRSFYGDSVRKAEALWGEFLAGRPVTTQAAAR